MFRLALLLLVATAFAQDDAPTAKSVAEDFFNAIDADDDGSIVRADVDVYFDQYSEDNDTAVSLDEFKDYLSAKRPELSDYFEDAFKAFDTDSDGSLDATDFDAAMLAGDVDGDGMATKDEFDALFVPLLEAIMAADNDNGGD